VSKSNTFNRKQASKFYMLDVLKFNKFYFLITQQYHSGLLQLELTV